MGHDALKATLKKVPGLVQVVQAARLNGTRITRAMLRRILAWASRTEARRSLLFEALPEGLVLAQHDRESYVVRTADTMIGRILYARGDFDFNKFVKACGILQVIGLTGQEGEEAPLLVDVGANVGSICIPAVKRGLVSRCLAFEPEAGNFALLRINLLVNGVADKVEAHPFAVGAKRDMVSLVRSSSNHGDHRIGVSGGDVQMVTLEDHLGEDDLRNTIIWIDVQGFEGYALQGARTICGHGTPLILEYCVSDMQKAGCFDILMDVLEQSRYAFFYDLAETDPTRQPLQRQALIELGARLESANTFTDLLLVPV